MNPKLMTAILLGLVACIAAVNARRYEQDYESDYDYKGGDNGYGKPDGGDNGSEKDDNGSGSGDDNGDNGKDGGDNGDNGENGGDNGDNGKDGGDNGDNGDNGDGKDGKDDGDIDAKKHKGFCHWHVGIWFKPGAARQCSCMRCVCQVGGNWKCDYHFAYCPYYYCGNRIYNPRFQLCCCGEVHDRKSGYSCCGYYYYDTKFNKCCKFFSVKPLKSVCPRFSIN